MPSDPPVLPLALLLFLAVNFAMGNLQDDQYVSHEARIVNGQEMPSSCYLGIPQVNRARPSVNDKSSPSVVPRTRGVSPFWRIGSYAGFDAHDHSTRGCSASVWVES